MSEMVIKSTKIVLPPKGKHQINLDRFNYSIKYQNSLFTIYLPCAKTKPYHKSKTHYYIRLKLRQYIPKIWRKLIRICTISEVIGIVPESIENSVFQFFYDDYYYEHYPNYEEGDIERTSRWLREYIEVYGTKYNYSYSTSRIFREIASNVPNLESLPREFNPKSALFEYRKTINVEQLMEKIVSTYSDILKERYLKWKSKQNHSFEVIEFAKSCSPFSFHDFKKKFSFLQNPKSNIATFCNESKSDKGIFLKYDKKQRKYFLPDCVIKLV